MEECFQIKRKRAVSIESDKSVPEKGLMVDVRRFGCEEEFF